MSSGTRCRAVGRRAGHRGHATGRALAFVRRGAHLRDEGAQLAHARDRENLQTSDVRDETAGTDVSAMEAIAMQAPLSAHQRPAWDLKVLRGLGMQAAADTEIWKKVWTREERINNASTPMFLVEGRKCTLLQ